MGWMLTLWTLISVKSLYLVLLFISNSQTYVKRDIISWLIIDKGVPIVWKICHILPSVLIKSVHLKKKNSKLYTKIFCNLVKLSWINATKVRWCSLPVNITLSVKSFPLLAMFRICFKICNKWHHTVESIDYHDWWSYLILVSCIETFSPFKVTALPSQFLKNKDPIILLWKGYVLESC